MGGGGDINEFPDFSTDNLLDSIDFDDLFAGMENEVDVLPDLEMDTAEIVNYTASSLNENIIKKTNSTSTKAEEDKVSKRNTPADKGKKSSKNHQAKRKVKVYWKPELHRRFVQVVEQLGVDKAVPSRILELMGIDCLTRHNIASHLQKYRSHRKHLVAREVEAAKWSQRRQIYSGGVGGGGYKREIMSNPNWFTPPTIGFRPPLAPMPHFRPLHVWGHPSSHIWPPTTPCFQPPTNSHAPPPVPGVPPHAMYKVDAIAALRPHTPIDFHPSKESIDAAIEDVLAKPWLPLPLGLKPPSTDSVVVELHRQGIERIPPTTSGG